MLGPLPGGQPGAGWKWEGYYQTSKHLLGLEAAQAARFRAEPVLPWAKRLVLHSPSPWHGHKDTLEDTEPSIAGAVPTDLIDGPL